MSGFCFSLECNALPFFTSPTGENNEIHKTFVGLVGQIVWRTIIYGGIGYIVKTAGVLYFCQNASFATNTCLLITQNVIDQLISIIQLYPVVTVGPFTLAVVAIESAAFYLTKSDRIAALTVKVSKD